MHNRHAPCQAPPIVYGFTTNKLNNASLKEVLCLISASNDLLREADGAQIRKMGDCKMQECPSVPATPFFRVIMKLDSLTTRLYELQVNFSVN